MPSVPVLSQAVSYATAAIALSIPRGEMMSAFGPAVQELLAVLGQQRIAPAGPLVAYHHRLEPGRFDFEVAFPVTGAFTPSGRVVASNVPAGTVAVAVHEGEYDTIAQSWMALDAWVAEQGHTPAGDFWEVYSVGPEAGRHPSAWRTILHRRLAE